MGWVTDVAPTRAELDACVACGLCLPHCPTYRATGDEAASPRGRLTAMAAVAEGLVEVDETFADLMGFCLQCRACETACPSLVPFGRAMEGARAEIAAQLPDRARSVRRFVGGTAIANPRLVGVATLGAAIGQRVGLGRTGDGVLGKLRGMRDLSPRRESTLGRAWPAIGARRGRAALLSGCVQDPWFPEVHDATIAVLRLAGYDVEAPRDQRCCGALAVHDGAVDATRSLAEANVAAFAGYDVVVSDAAGCGAHLKDYGHWAEGGEELASRVADVTELVARLIDGGVLPDFEHNGITVAVQDPCHLRHAQRIVGPPRRVVGAAGYTVVDLDPSGRCCGAAGMYMVAHPEMSDELGRQKARQMAATPAAIVASANPGCEIQLRTYASTDVRIVHPIELYADAVARSE
jgi:glycolate oxidase iron-sulfur subunit